ncbi:MAG TPA: tyrosine-type recombinase/integrase [Xanthobacteraceae bacterium]
MEIIEEALKNSNKDFVFASPLDNQPLNRKAMATALRGTRQKKDGKMVIKTPGICALLGLKPFTPHDLRRTAATLAGDLGFHDAWIAKCLDHAASKKSEQIVPTVTGKVYNHSKRMKEKRAVIDGVAAELRRIISEPAEATLCVSSPDRRHGDIIFVLESRHRHRRPAQPLRANSRPSTSNHPAHPADRAP